MRTFSIYTLGCKVNQYESAQIRQFLEGLGLAAVKPVEKPDLFVINTCCVTATASAKSRQYIQRAKKLNKSAKKVICGCLAALKTKELRSIENKSTCLVASREALASKLSQIIGGARSGCSLTNSTNISDIAQHSSIKPDNEPKINTFTGLTSLPKLPLLTAFKEHTRAFLKVQDGCDGVCSYCIIPKIRPDVQNKPIFEAISEAKALVSAGHKEIVVTGVNLGSYGRTTTKKAQISDCRLSIVDLLEELAKVSGLARIRVSSLEPGDISEELLNVFCRYPNIMPHIHLSVQSGSDRILRRMCRQYSADDLREKIALIKSRLDRPAITCDIIVGFPGETEEDFQQTVELAKWAGFSKMHVFGFSLREGTAAAKMKDKIQPKVVKQRAEVLRKLGDELAFKFREQFIGENCEVLIEGSKDGKAFGRCERYFMIYLGPLLRNPPPFCFSPQCGASQNVTRVCPLLIRNRIKTLGVYAALRGTPLRCENEIVKVRITAVTEEGAAAEAANTKF